MHGRTAPANHITSHRITKKSNRHTSDHAIQTNVVPTEFEEQPPAAHSLAEQCQGVVGEVAATRMHVAKHSIPGHCELEMMHESALINGLPQVVYGAESNPCTCETPPQGL